MNKRNLIRKIEAELKKFNVRSDEGKDLYLAYRQISVDVVMREDLDILGTLAPKVVAYSIGVGESYYLEIDKILDGRLMYDGDVLRYM